MPNDKNTSDANNAAEDTGQTEKTDAQTVETQAWGTDLVGKRGMYWLLAYSVVLAVTILTVIYFTLPSCVSLGGELSLLMPAAGNSNTNASNQNANANANVNVNASLNANANVNVRANVNANVNANRNVGNAVPANGGNTTNVAGNQNPGGETGNRLRIISVSPKFGLTGGNSLVVIDGNGFTPETAVYFNGIPAETKQPVPVSGESITVVSPPGTGQVDIAARNPKTGDSYVLPSAYSYGCAQMPESRLLLVVIFAGALGGALHSLRSFYWYTGHRKLVRSWVPMYLLLPFIGALMATVFFLVLYGGFLPNTPTSATYWFTIGIGVMVGLFSKQAALKLESIANVILLEPQPGEQAVQEKATAAGVPTANQEPAITIDPPSGAGGEVTIKGENFKKITKIVVEGKEVPFKSVPNSNSVTFHVPPQSETGDIVVVKIYADDGAKPSEILTYTYQK